MAKGKRAWNALVGKYRFEPEEITWKLVDELRCIKMTTNQNPDGYILSDEQPRSDHVAHNL